jgi:hypothetical protein
MEIDTKAFKNITSCELKVYFTEINFEGMTKNFGKVLVQVFITVFFIIIKCWKD